MMLKEVLESVEKEGYKVTPNQIWRYQEAGLLPKPEVKSLGGRKGKESIFEDGTEKQLLQICILKKKSKDNNYVLWNLWLDGFDVDFDKMKELIKESVTSIENLKQKVLKNEKFEGFDILDRAEKIIKFDDSISQFTKGELGCLGIKENQDINWLSIILRMLIFNDQEVIEELKQDIEAKNIFTSINSDQVYINKIKFLANNFDKNLAKTFPDIFDEFDNVNIIEYFKYIPSLSSSKSLSEVIFNLDEEQLAIANKIFKLFKILSYNFSKIIGFEWESPKISFLIPFFLGDKDLITIMKT